MVRVYDKRKITNPANRTAGLIREWSVDSVVTNSSRSQWRTPVTSLCFDPSGNGDFLVSYLGVF